MLADVGSGQIRVRDDCCGPQDEPPPPQTPSTGAVWRRTRAAWRLEPNTVYYLKHPGPNLSLWRAHHRRTSFLKCTFHAACQSDQSTTAEFTVPPPLFLFLCSDSHRQNESIYTKWIPDQKQQAEPAEARAARTASGRVSDSRTLAVQPAKLIALLEPRASSNVA